MHRQHSLPVPAYLHLKRVKVAVALGLDRQAVESLTQYLIAASPEEERREEALGLLADYLTREIRESKRRLSADQEEIDALEMRVRLVLESRKR